MLVSADNISAYTASHAVAAQAGREKYYAATFEQMIDNVPRGFRLAPVFHAKTHETGGR